MAFKIGDRVRFTDPVFSTSAFYGREGTIIEPRNTRDEYSVRFDELRDLYFIWGKSLSLINPQPFHTNDRVRTQNGHVGTVIFSGEKSTQVEFPGQCPRVVPFNTSSLELVERGIDWEIAQALINRNESRQQVWEGTTIPRSCSTLQYNSKETTTMQIGSHAVTDVTRDSVKVGCQTVTRDQAKAVLEAMDAVPKSAFKITRDGARLEIGFTGNISAGARSWWCKLRDGLWSEGVGQPLVIELYGTELKELIAELQKFV